MQGTTQNYTLDMADGTAPKPLIVKQGDTNSRWARISLVAFKEPWTIPFGCQIHINVRKKDMTYANATCTQEDEHTVLAPITEQMTTVPGTQLGELFFLGTDGDIRSQTFPLVVWDAVTDLDLMQSSNDFQALKAALRDVKISTETADIATQYATEQGNAAGMAAQRAEDAADSIQVAVDAAAAAKACESNARDSELAAAQTQQEVRDYVEAQKAAFVGYSKRESDSKYANAITATAEGEGGVTVGDAWTAPVLDMEVVGRSEQVQTTGAQILDFEQCLKEWNSKYTQSSGRVYTVNTLGDGFYNPISFSDEDIKVTLSGKVRDISGSRYRIELLDSSENLVGRIDKDTKSITAMASKIRLNFTEGGVGEYADIMLNAGDTALPWEPYTGGAPSPSPDYPQDIISTGTVSTGAQLLDLPDTSGTVGGIKYSFKNGEITATGTPDTQYNNIFWYRLTLSPGEYYISGGDVSAGNMYAQVAIDKDGVRKNYVNRSFSVTGDETAMSLNIQNGASTASISCTFKPMLNAGTIPKPWEPYTGGKPAPSVEYPQTLEVTATGAQLLDYHNGRIQGTGVTYMLKDGEITLNGTASNDGGIFLIGESFTGDIANLTLPNGSYSVGGYPQNTGLYFYRVGNSASSFSVKSNTVFTIGNTLDAHIRNDFVSVSLRWTKGAVFNNEKFKIMLNAGETLLPWEPYRSTTVPITLTEPLRGIEDYRDRIICRDGVWGVERWIAKREITTESVIVLDNGRSGCTLGKRGGLEGVRGVLCSNASIATYSDKVSCGQFYENPANIVLVGNVGDTSQSLWDLYGGGYFVYPLATPTWEPLPDATQQALNALTTYAGTTHLTITAGGTTPTVTLDYVKDTHKALEQCQEAAKEYTDNQIAAIVAALPTATQAAIVDNQTTRLLQEV